jgi:outer membrane protein assembly factor BamB
MNLNRVAAGLLIASLAGCSSLSDTVGGWIGRNKPGASEQAKLVDFIPTATLAVRWHSDIGGANHAALQPVVSEHRVYAANAKGELIALDAADGQPLWRVNSGFTVSAGVGAGDNVLLLGGEKGDVAAFDMTGKLRWTARVSSEVSSAPQVAEGLVLVRTGDGRITALSLLDGKRQWVYERATPALVVRNHAGVTVQRGVLYAGFAAGKLAAIHLNNGAVLWESAVSQPRGHCAGKYAVEPRYIKRSGHDAGG